ncbi:MAG TPA: ATP-dependent DNA helicase, partial [Alphaproteobacteria bacterium]
MSGKMREAVKLPTDKPLLVCHAPYTFSRLNLSASAHFDVLELFAFVRPAVFCVPTVGGLCRALGLPVPQSAEDAAASLFTIVNELLLHLKEEKNKQRLIDLASAMGASGQGWAWTPAVIEALGGVYNPTAVTRSREALDVWTDLPEWAEEAPIPPPANNIITGEAARAHLHDLITRRRAAGRGGDGRTAQDNYT